MRLLILLALLVVGVRTVAAQEKSFRVSLGYAYAKILEQGGGDAPLGGFLSVSGGSRKAGAELELGYHRDREKFLSQTFTLTTVTLMAGPRVRMGSGRTQPYIHLLGGVRHDSFEGAGNTSFGAMAGVGADLPATSSLFVRLGADFQLFVDEGNSLKVLRLIAGIAF
jgi:hypothetical protein